MKGLKGFNLLKSLCMCLCVTLILGNVLKRKPTFFFVVSFKNILNWISSAKCFYFSEYEYIYYNSLSTRVSKGQKWQIMWNIFFFWIPQDASCASLKTATLFAYSVTQQLWIWRTLQSAPTVRTVNCLLTVFKHLQIWIVLYCIMFLNFPFLCAHKTIQWRGKQL